MTLVVYGSVPTSELAHLVREKFAAVRDRGVERPSYVAQGLPFKSL
jgi:hypothetical protein